MFEFQQYLGFLLFLTVFTIGFWLLVFLFSFVVPYWLYGGIKEFVEEKLAERKQKTKK